MVALLIGIGAVALLLVLPTFVWANESSKEHSRAALYTPWDD
jgi:hypothetical protein